MPRPTIDYLNARRALKPESGGKIYPRLAKYAPEEDGPSDNAVYTLWVMTNRRWRRIQKLGRVARWQKLTAEQRSAIMRGVARARWGNGASSPADVGNQDAVCVLRGGEDK